MPLSVGNSVCVRLEDVLNDILKNHYSFMTFLLEPIVLEEVIAVEKHSNFGFENLVVSSVYRVLIDSSYEPPTGISTIIAGIVS